VQHDLLAPLFAPVITLRGIGPALAALLARATGGERVLDLLFHLPESYLDRRDRPTIARARAGEVATLAVHVVRHEPPANSRQPWKIVVGDGTGFMELVFFRAPRDGQMPVGAHLLVSGKLDRFNERLTMPHPDHVVPAEQEATLPRIEPIWRLTAGLWPRQVARAMAQAVERVPEFPEWHDPALLRREAWPGFAAALRAVQVPDAPPDPRARNRLAYDELLADQVARALIRGRLRLRPGRALVGDGRLRAQALARFGYAPTPSQTRALAEIDADLASPRRMLRLLQGDVGSGKTLVALLAMLRAVEAGAQAALMAPTEMLAQQHHRVLSRLSPAPVALLTGSVKGRARALLLRGLADGSVPMVVGTHALFQDTVEYRDLAVAVIDEQHRFGVDQRLLMGGKGEKTDVLVMTATPIPRTLTMTVYGDLDVSTLDEMPAHRGKIVTALRGTSKLPDAAAFIRRELESGRQAYIVYPLIEESDKLEAKAAAQEFEKWRKLLAPMRCELLHGRIDPAEKEALMEKFRAGQVQALIATSVIEVGIDVPNATIMLIENAERFGLAQLHQLRGRIGRGSHKSWCILISDATDPAALEKLHTLEETADGFKIAEADLRLRGPGDILGTAQSGLPPLKLGNLLADQAWMRAARESATRLFKADPQLDRPEHRAFRDLITGQRKMMLAQIS
jgi:ATP-dependent DNA helicase RecG